MVKKQKILIVDDSEMNRALLADILEEQYEVTEAENGLEAVKILAENKKDFWFVLLDIMMPEMDGFEVLNYINNHYWNDRVVVMMISSDDSPENISVAYSLGAFDYIARPFNPIIVHKRIANTMFLYARQHDLENAVKEQFYEQQQNNDLMITILSHIVESRNGESGLHIQNVRIITKLLLNRLLQITDRYPLSDADINLISMASALHDIGKMAVPEHILNKPGKLTDEEFATMKSHSEMGAKMLAELPEDQFNLPLVKVSYEICRWHHERYDGRGYPDGLKGEEIPISAQIVALADVYDALTSERCYKKAFSHEEAMSMILEGKCGVFSPILLQCFTEISDRLKNRNTKPDWKQEKEKSQHNESKTKDKGLFRKKEHDKLTGQSGYMQLLYVDPLTSVYNRRYYEEYIQDAPYVEAVALIDIDNLKQVNDDYGQEVGDLALKKTSQTLLSLIRKTDYLVRYGGDKFLIVFVDMTKPAFNARIEEIRRSFEGMTLNEHPELHITVNIKGVCGKGKEDKIFHIVDDMLGQWEHPEEQVSIRFLDNEKDSVDNA